MHVPEYSLKLSRPFCHHSAAFSIIVVGNQIADYALPVDAGLTAGEVHRTACPGAVFPRSAPIDRIASAAATRG
jgi:hypothetical protein